MCELTRHSALLTSVAASFAQKWPTLRQVLLHVTNYADKYGHEAAEEAKRAANLTGEQDDEDWSEGEDDTLPDKVPKQQ